MNTNFYLREKRQICLLASDHITNDLNLQINCKELHGMKSKAFSISFKLHLSTQVKKWVCSTPMQFGLACAAYKINHDWGMPKKGPCRQTSTFSSISSIRVLLYLQIHTVVQQQG